MSIFITFYEDEMRTLFSLPDEMKGRIFNAVLADNLGEDIPTLEPAENAIFSLINSQIQRAKKKSDKQSQNAKKRWESGNDIKDDNSNDMQNDTNGMPTLCQTLPTSCTYTITDTKTITKTDTNSPPTPSKGEKGASMTKEQQERFDQFWAVYPRKTAKKNAFNAWQKLSPDGELTEKILLALEQHKKTAQWQEVGGKYIPYPATWLNGRRWEDEGTDIKPSIPDYTAGVTEGVDYL